MIIQNEKAAGKFAYGFKYTVVEGIFNNETKTLNFYYADPVYENYKHGKMNSCTMEIDAGYITSGYKKHKLELVGNIEELIKNSSIIKGITYEIKDIIKSHGFKWNKENKYWTK